jgi:hypothetical protein
MREVLEPLIAERGERCTIVRQPSGHAYLGIGHWSNGYDSDRLFSKTGLSHANRRLKIRRYQQANGSTSSRGLPQAEVLVAA